MIPPGVQAWYRDTIAATTDAFAYCSTMALLIFRLKDNCLHKMIAAHEKPISAICWSPKDPNLIASCCVDGRVTIWDVDNEEERFGMKLGGKPLLIDWAAEKEFEGAVIALVLQDGDVCLWEYRKDNNQSKLFNVGERGGKVLRWHPRVTTKLLVGCGDGSLVVFETSTRKKHSIVGKSKTSKDAVTDAQWDPLSEDYLLASFKDGSLALFDASTEKEVHQFERQHQGISALAWARGQPGNFVTVTDRVGVLRLWNVSQRAPLLQIKVGTAGVVCIKAVPSEPSWFVLSFKNSSVGVCDIASRTMRFTSSPGHSETIFDVAFHPNDPDLLGTASYDGHVKLWRISTGASEREMYAGKEQTLYGLAFAPDATRVCAVSSVGVVFIWNSETGTQLHRLQVHTGRGFRCEWTGRRLTGGLETPEDMGEILTGGADGFVCITDPVSGTVKRRVTHPASVVGVHYSPHALASGCQDGHVRIFPLKDVVTAGMNDLQPKIVLKGHEARVFNVAFNPLCPHLLASGSDDKTIRVWNTDCSLQPAQRELRRLSGHTSYVRALLWHTELPGILFSGSWDSTIRVWDVVGQRCLHVTYEHHADVYGLTLHPRRPFFLVSSSRDTTLRYWVFEDLVRPMLVHALARPQRASDILGGDPSEVMALISATPASPSAVSGGGVNKMPGQLRLYGQASRALLESLALMLAEKGPLPVTEKLVSFFMYRTGIEDLWGLLAALRGEPTAGTSTQRAVFHERELIACQKSKALELASQRVAIGVVGKQEDRLLKAAQLMLRIGDLRSYCRFTMQAGHPERAICIAPAVSHQFWLELCGEYVETLSASADIDEVAPLWVATGQAARLTDEYIGRSELDSAFVVAKADCDQLLPPAGVAGGGAGAADAAGVAAAGGGERSRERLDDIAGVLAKRYASLGEPVQAAMCFLAVSRSSRAVHTLSRSHEVVLAFAVSELLGQPKDPIVLKLLAQCAERDDRWDLAAELWLQHPLGVSLHLPLLAACCPSEAARTALAPHTQGNFQEHQERLKAALASGDHAAAVLSAVCAGDYAQAAHVGITALHALFSRSGGWTLAEARRLLAPLESLDFQNLAVREIAEVLACAAYVGLVEASTMGYADLIFPLAQTLRNIITHQSLAFPVTTGEICLLEATATMHRLPSHASQVLADLLNSQDFPAHLRPACEFQLTSLRSRPPVAEWDHQDGPGFWGVAGSRLPLCYKRYAKMSVLTNELIKGPAFELEDPKLYISYTDALGWARVNAFSPLNTGCKIYPI